MAKVAFEALILPLIDYCSIAYGFTHKTHFNRIEVLKRRATTIITFSGLTTVLCRYFNNSIGNHLRKD